MPKFFKKRKKNTILCLFWGKTEFPSKLCSYHFFFFFFDLGKVYHCAKFQKKEKKQKNKLVSRFQTALVSDGRMHGKFLTDH